MRQSWKAQARDEADEAWEQEQNNLNEALWNARRSSRLQSRGKCYNCGEAVEGLFCDKDCRGDYEKEQEITKRQRAQQCAGKEHPQ